VLLTRQDWRGPLASWAEGGLGYWEVDVRESGEYECSLLFPAAATSGSAWVGLGGVRKEVSLAQGATSATVRLSGVSKGLSRVEAGLVFEGTAPVGPHYVDVRRVV
jgi:hypothetical protein